MRIVLGLHQGLHQAESEPKVEHEMRSTSRTRILQPAIRASRLECIFNSSGKA